MNKLFYLQSITSKHNVKPLDVERWLWTNVGPGGHWLYNRVDDTIEREQGDEWGMYYYLGSRVVEILDEKKALMFVLKWV